jgi:hypothetical protein
MSKPHHNLTILTHRFQRAQTSLSTISNDVLLVILDWLVPIAEIAAEEARSIPEKAKMMRATLLSVSQVNHRFRIMLAPRIFNKLMFDHEYNSGSVTRWLDAVSSSQMLQHCVR